MPNPLIRIRRIPRGLPRRRRAASWRRLDCIAAAALAATLLGVAPAHTQEFPSRPIRFIVPTTAGTTTDFLARLLGQEMTKTLGQPVVVEDKPGANQIIGMELVAKQAPADGHTVVVVGTDSMVLLPLTTKGLRFDPMKDLVPINGIAEARYVLAGPSARPWKTFQELVAHAKANPGKLNYGSSVHQVRLPVLILMQELGLDVVHVPYSGGGPYLQALAGGILDFGIAGEAVGQSLVPRVQFFAVTGTKRMTNHPSVPTFSELGFPQIRGPAYALFARAGTAPGALDKLGAAAAAALDQPEVRAALAKMLLEVNNDRADTVQKKLADQAKSAAELAKKIKLAPE